MRRKQLPNREGRINAQEGREQYQACGQNCDPLDENNDFIAGVESQTFSAKGPFLTGWLHMYLFMIGLRGVEDSLQGFTPHDPIVGEMGHPPLLAVVGKENPLPSHAQVFGSVQN